MKRKGGSSQGANRQPDTETIAAALALEATQGAKAACEAFNVSRRSLQRYKRAIAEQPSSHLAQCVARAKVKSLARVDDLLTSAWEMILKRLQMLVPDADMDQTLEAAKVIGELRLTRDALGGDEASGNHYDPGKGPAAPEAAGRDTGFEAGAGECQTIN
jgi:hypothetical protein